MVGTVSDTKFSTLHVRCNEILKTEINTVLELRSHMHDNQTFSSPFAQEVGMINLRAAPGKRFFTDPAVLWIVPGRVCCGQVQHVALDQ